MIGARTRRVGVAGVAALVCLAAAAPGPSQVADDLRRAVLARDAEAVMACLTSGARTRYRDLYRIARRRDDASVPPLANDERALVRVLRRRAGPQLEASATLDAFLASSLARSRVDEVALARIRLGATRQSPGAAVSQVLREGVPTGVQLSLVREGEAWRLARVSSALLDPLALRLASAASGLDEDAVVDRLVDGIVGK